MTEDKLKFKNGVFTLLQVSDAQDLQYVRRTMLWMLDKAYDRVRPDLILLTGDNTLGNHFRDALPVISRLKVNTKEREFLAMRKALKYVLKPIVERNIPFAMIYGNHDDMNEISKDEQAQIYREYPGCTGLDNPDKSVDCDTYNIPVYSEDGERIAFNLWMLDSAWTDQTQHRGYCEIKPETVEWYNKTSQALKDQNDGRAVPSILFQHVPLPDTLRLIKESENKRGAVEEKGKYYRLNSYAHGVMGEYPNVCGTDSGLFEAVKKNGDVKAVVFGHDHLNCFEGKVDGIDFIQTPAASFRCYGSPVRGVRVFRLFEDGSYKTEHLSYFELCGRNPVSAARYLWDADDMWKAKAASIAVLTLAVSAAAVSIILKKL